MHSFAKQHVHTDRYKALNCDIKTGLMVMVNTPKNSGSPCPCEASKRHVFLHFPKRAFYWNSRARVNSSLETHEHVWTLHLKLLSSRELFTWNSWARVNSTLETLEHVWTLLLKLSSTCELTAQKSRGCKSQRLRQQGYQPPLLLLRALRPGAAHPEDYLGAPGNKACNTVIYGEWACSARQAEANQQ